MKNILTFKLYEAVYLSDINPFDRTDKKYPGGLRFVNRDEALRSVRRIQEMLDKKEMELKDAIIASYIMSERAKNHKFPKPGIKDGGAVWSTFLETLKKKEGN